jgi:hypothetical protein
MPAPRYVLITGEFYVLYPDLPRNGPEPDGDTISFGCGSPAVRLAAK